MSTTKQISFAYNCDRYRPYYSICGVAVKKPEPKVVDAPIKYNQLQLALQEKIDKVECGTTQVKGL